MPSRPRHPAARIGAHEREPGAGEAGIPAPVVKALKRWEKNGSETRLEVQSIIRVSRPEVLEELRRSPAARFLGENLGSVTAIVKGGARLKIQAALMELGLIAEVVGNEPEE